jgi:hypothetical protein
MVPQVRVRALDANLEFLLLIRGVPIFRNQSGKITHGTAGRIILLPPLES